MRALLVWLCRLLLRVYFSRVEITGLERVPKSGPIVIVLNHPNGLLDPVFVLTCAGRRVSFLAKEPLFRMPLVGFFVRSFECLPVYRKADGADPKQNRAIVQASVDLLRTGNVLALFPEGTSHSDPSLQPFRTGAARIALAAASPTLGAEDVGVVPCGLYYSDKSRFRSKALVTFGEPIVVPKVELDANFEPPAPEVRQFTRELEQALSQVTLNAPSIEVLRLSERGARIVRAADLDEAILERRGAQASSIEELLELRARMIDGYTQLMAQDPGALAPVLAQMDAFDSKMAQHQLRIDQQVLFPFASALRYVAGALLLTAVLLPLALVGVVMNVGSYHLVAWLARRYGKEEDVVSTAKVVGGMLIYPLAWLGFALAIGFWLGPVHGLALLTVAPLAAFAALSFLERARHAFNQGYVVLELWLRPGLRRSIVRERRRIREQLLELERRLQGSQARGR